MSKGSSRYGIKLKCSKGKNRIKILFVCYANIMKSFGKASKINGSAEWKSVYYTTRLLQVVLFLEQHWLLTNWMPKFIQYCYGTLL